MRHRTTKIALTAGKDIKQRLLPQSGARVDPQKD